MARVLVVSQPMFLPWIGLFEQVRIADVFVHYDDVQLPQGRSFVTRVQIKSPANIAWMTAPVDHRKSGKLISEIRLFAEGDWRSRHLKTLRHAYARAPYFESMFALAEQIYACPSNCLCDFNIAAIEKIAHWLSLSPQFLRSSDLNVGGSGTQRLIDLCEKLECDTYVTGHGALRYLNHQEFDQRGVSVRYIDYKKAPYRQGTSEFTPYVSILDAIAHCGEEARNLLRSDAIGWKEFRNRQAGT